MEWSSDSAPSKKYIKRDPINESDWRKDHKKPTDSDLKPRPETRLILPMEEALRVVLPGDVHHHSSTDEGRKKRQLQR
jgi:hypothetical protein